MPEYASEEYWNQFIDANPDPFDWLLESATVFSILKDFIPECTTRSKLLHIGFGNSDLTWSLPKLVQHHSQIHNVDFSASAVGRGIQEEKASIGRSRGDGRVDEVLTF